MKPRDPWLCLLGLHFWNHVGFVNLLLSDEMRECRRCQRRKMLFCYGQGHSIETREQRNARLNSQRQVQPCN